MSVDNPLSVSISASSSVGNVASNGSGNVDATDLSLVGKRLTSLPTDGKYANLTKIDLTDNDMNSWKGFENLTKLESLVLDKNNLKAGSLATFPQLSSLQTLWINNNQIADLKLFLDAIEKCFPNLSYLSMLKNPACPNLYFSDGEAEAYQRYRYYVIFRVKKLKFLDSTPVEPAEHKEALRVGKLMQPAKPQGENGIDEGDQGKAGNGGYKPHLHQKPPKAASFLGKGKPRYDGSNSEGNRFIFNEDL